MLKTLYIFNASNVQIGSITEYADDTVTKTLNNAITFEFTSPFTSTTKSLLVVGNKVQVDSDFFIISQVEDIKSQSDYYRHCICEGLHYELANNLIKASHSYTGIVALFEAATAGSGWSVILEGSYTPPNDLDMTASSTLVHAWDYENSLKIINVLSEKWKVEVAYTADVVSGSITNKKIHLYQQRGATRTAQYTFSTNIESLKKITDFTGIETRIIGVGAVLSSDGTTNTYQDFSSVEWTTPSKPVNKPAGQIYVEDAAAVALYGIRTGTYKLNTIDAAQLLTNSYRSLQARKQPYIGYEVAVGDLYSLIGDANYTCNIGDTIPVYDADLDINITARVKELSYCPNDGTQTKVTLANYRRLVDVETIPSIQEDIDATQSYVAEVSTDLEDTKASLTITNEELLLKADKTYVDSELADKADTSWVSSSISTTANQIKLDVQNGTTAAGKVSNSAVTITSTQVAIDTQNFNLTLRDAGNLPRFAINASSGGLLAKDASQREITRINGEGIKVTVPSGVFASGYIVPFEIYDEQIGFSLLDCSIANVGGSPWYDWNLVAHYLTIRRPDMTTLFSVGNSISMLETDFVVSGQLAVNNEIVSRSSTPKYWLSYAPEPNTYYGRLEFQADGTTYGSTRMNLVVRGWPDSVEQQWVFRANGDLKVPSSISFYGNRRTTDDAYGAIHGYNDGNGYQHSTKFYTFKSPNLVSEAYGMSQDYGSSYDGDNSYNLSFFSRSVNNMGKITWFTGAQANSKTYSMALDRDANLRVLNSVYAYALYENGVSIASKYMPATVGGFELHPGAVGHGGNIDFHFNGSRADNTARIIEIGSAGRLNMVTNVYVDGNMSAATITDRTKGYTGQDALAELRQVRNDENGDINHSTLPEQARVKLKNYIDKETKGPMLRKTFTADDIEEVDEEGRDLGMMISMLTVAVQQLADEIDRLKQTKGE